MLYVAVLALLFLGGKGTDVGQLRPVEVVQLYEKNGFLLIKTDTGDTGWGVGVEEAVEKLKNTAPGRIYLDTADYLLIEEGLEEYLPAIYLYLKGRTAGAYGLEEMDLQEAAAYLRVHRPLETVGKGENPREKLIFQGGKIILKKCKKK